MNSQELNAIWNTICNQIKSYDGIDASQIDAIFSRLELQAMSSGCAFITTESDFIRDWVQRYYMDSIHKAFFDLYSVDFSLFLELTKATKQDQATQAQAAPEIPKIPEEKIETNTNQTLITKIETPVTKSEELISEEHQDIFDIIDEIEQNTENDPLTFENFVIGNSNKTAYKMALAVAEMPGKKTGLNPLFIHGKPGLGKTHLLRAIQNYIKKTQPYLKVIYVDSSEFVNDYTDCAAAHDKNKESFKNFRIKYEESDVLLLDDVQFLQFKTASLEMLFQIFNKYISQGKQIVLSADRAPKNIDIDERYWSRFASGGTFDIQPPEFETKLGIIKSYIDEYNSNEDSAVISIPLDIQSYIAEHSSSNIRELKGAVTNIICNLIDKKTITLAEAAEILKEHFTGNGAKKITIASIQTAVEEFYKVKHADLISKKRGRNIAYPRQIAIYLCREMITEASFEQIGAAFDQHHSTAMYSYSTIEEKITSNRELAEEIEALKHIILEK